MIFSSPPSNWRDLQDKVAKIFKDIGFKTEVEKDVATARGVVNIDVFAEDESQSLKLIYLCECKWWDKAVPKSVIHSFRTVVSDFGANYGLLISREGFQEGAYEAARFTNINLLDWDQFQELFEDKWFNNYMAPQVNEICSPLVAYTEPINSRVLAEAGKLDSEKQIQFRALRSKYQAIAFFALQIGIPIFLPELRGSKQLMKQAVSSGLFAKLGQTGLPDDLLEASAMIDFFNILVAHCQAGIREFDNLFGKPIR